MGKAVIVTSAVRPLHRGQGSLEAQSILQDMREGIDPRDVKRLRRGDEGDARRGVHAYVDRPGKLKQSTRERVPAPRRQGFHRLEGQGPSSPSPR